jgi:hypothetical protein
MNNPRQVSNINNLTPARLITNAKDIEELKSDNLTNKLGAVDMDRRVVLDSVKNAYYAIMNNYQAKDIKTKDEYFNEIVHLAFVSYLNSIQYTPPEGNIPKGVRMINDIYNQISNSILGLAMPDGSVYINHEACRLHGVDSSKVEGHEFHHQNHDFASWAPLYQIEAGADYGGGTNT